MSDFYEPTLLFRQNAIKRFQTTLSPIASASSLDLPGQTYSPYQSNHSKSSNWLLNHNPKDTEILSKSCSLNRTNIKSNYWKIPDNDMNLTSLAVSSNESDSPLLAISSANRESNLFIYELDVLNNYLTHHNTISLPNIHSMRWVPNQNSRYLVTGNNKGYAHLVSVPTPYLDEEQESAEILKRFNHRKHLKSIGKDASIFTHKRTNISKLEFGSQNNLFSVYDDNLFLWDMKDCDTMAKPRPLTISSIYGLHNFDVSSNDNVVGICGKFGVSLLDMRNPKFNVPEAVIKQANRKKLLSNVMKWSSFNEYVFAAGHMDGVIRLWDVRKQDSFANLDGHQGKSILSLEWNKYDIFSGGNDGNIVHWDLTSDIEGVDFSNDRRLRNCGLREGLDSVRFNPLSNKLEQTIKERQCGTVLPASNTRIVGMASIKNSDADDLRVLSIDGSSFFGVHSKIYDAVSVNVNNDKLYYTQEDIDLMITAQNSQGTLVNSSVESVDQITKPLSITRKPTQVSQEMAEVSRKSSVQVSRKNTVKISEPPAEISRDSSIKVSEPSINATSLSRSGSLFQSNHISTETLLTEPIDYKLNFDVDQFDESVSRKNSLGLKISTHTDDFNFNGGVFDNLNESAVSVDSDQKEVSLSPSSCEGSFNNSLDTLSTNPTTLNEIELVKAMDTFDFAPLTDMIELPISDFHFDLDEILSI